MFCKKLVLIAATAALALGTISAKEASNVHVRVHSHGKNVCSGPGQSPMSVEGVAGVFCVSGQACVANISNGACPGPQAGLPNGAVCGVVKTGVYGCKPAPPTPAPVTPPSTCNGPNSSPMSVEGVPGVFCVTGQACVANISNGACPGPQAGLPHGASCGIVKTGVYGCKPNGSKHHHKKSHSKNVCSGPGQSPMSVEGVAGVFCVSGQACVANISNGACPGPQAGLPNGAECGKVKSGVYGCKPKASGGAAPQTAAPQTGAPKTTDAPKSVTPTVGTVSLKNSTVTANKTTTITTVTANKTVSLMISLSEDDSEDSADAVVDLTVSADADDDSDDSTDAADDDDSDDSDDSTDAAADDSDDSTDAAVDSEDSDDSEDRRL